MKSTFVMYIQEMARGEEQGTAAGFYFGWRKQPLCKPRASAHLPKLPGMKSVVVVVVVYDNGVDVIVVICNFCCCWIPPQV